MIILALDQASRVSGYSIFQDAELKEYGHFSVSPSYLLPQRLNIIKEKTLQLIKKWKPDKLYIEDIQLQDNVANNVATFKTLAQVIGVLSEMAYSIKLPLEIIPSLSWKEGLNIGGNCREEQKENSKKYVENKYNIIPTSDEADAICIGDYAINRPIKKIIYKKEVYKDNPHDWTS